MTASRMNILVAVLGLTWAAIASAEPAATTNPPNDDAAPSHALGGSNNNDGTATRGLLPSGDLFDPLLADPRWPHMGASYQSYDNHDLAQDTAAVSLGGTLALYRDDTPSGYEWELGLQGGVFAIFDLRADSEDLLNADYMVGSTLVFRRDDVSIMTRFFHQSSHIGDEFLLANPDFERVNYSFEAIDAILSRHLCDGALRFYGGGRFRFDLDPVDLEHWSGQYGVEWQSRRTYVDDLIRPIAALDVQHHEQNDWEADLSMRAGVQIETPNLNGHTMQVLGEYYNGHSPHGQFYDDRVQYVGVGVHFYY